MDLLPPELLIHLATYLPVQDVQAFVCTTRSFSITLTNSWRLLYHQRYPSLVSYTQNNTDFYEALKGLDNGTDHELSFMARMSVSKSTQHVLGEFNPCFCKHIVKHDYSQAFLFAAEQRRCLCYNSDFLQYVVRGSSVQVLHEIVTHHHLVKCEIYAEDLLALKKKKKEVAALLLEVPDLHIFHYADKQNICTRLSVEENPEEVVQLLYPVVADVFDQRYFNTAIHYGCLSSVYVKNFDIRGQISLFFNFQRNKLKLLRTIIEDLHYYPNQQEASDLTVKDADYGVYFMKYDYIVKDKSFTNALFMVDRGFLLTGKYHIDHLHTAISNNAIKSIHYLINHQDFWYDDTALYVLTCMSTEAIALRILKRFLSKKDTYRGTTRLIHFVFFSMKKNYVKLIYLFFTKYKMTSTLFDAFAKHATYTQLNTLLNKCQLESPDAAKVVRYYLRRNKHNHVRVLYSHREKYPSFYDKNLYEQYKFNLGLVVPTNNVNYSLKD